MCCGDEADGIIPVTVVATGVSSMPYNVTITPSELTSVSLREVFDYSNDTIVVIVHTYIKQKLFLISLHH